VFSAAKLDEVPKAAWIAAVVLAFIVWWPAGIALLVFLGISGRLNVLACGSRGRWHNADAHRGRGCSWGGRREWRGRSSGNQAFDDYREETLRRLEDEQREFAEYLDRLRRARDKTEFDQFMAERLRRSDEPQPPTPQGD
jgi:hypothetical protein